MQYVPVLVRLAALAGMELRLFPRDQHPDVMDQFLSGTARAIPIFAFFDREMNSLGRWGSRLPRVQSLIAAEVAKLPPKDHPDYSALRREAYAPLRRIYYEEQEQLQQDTITDLCRLLSDALHR